jgi:hypothetical protein
MRSLLNQRTIERAVRAAHKAGRPPSKVECHPDGRIVLCFGHTPIDAEDTLDRELMEWKRGNATD